MGIPEGAAMQPPTVLFIAHWRLLIFGIIKKSLFSKMIFKLRLCQG
jgi:hypothetical protein